MSESTWQRYPKGIMEKALQQKPGLMGIDYAFAQTDNFNDRLEHMDDYLTQWEESPNKTDNQYLSRIVMNIIFRGIRSS